jgi:NAD-dependent SIR2 family protein deacetylase
MRIIKTTLLWMVCWGTIGVVDAAKKVKRVKAGMKYKDKDAVHVVVNKVG